MAIRDYFIKDKPVKTEAKSMALGLNDALGAFLMLGRGGRGATPASALALYEKSSAVSIPINRIATAIANLNLAVARSDGVVIPDHPVLELLRKPSPYFSRSLFMETIAKNYMITGESCVVAIGGVARPPLELQPISPAKLTVPEGYGGLPANVNITGNTMSGVYMPRRKGNDIRYTRDSMAELVFIRNYSTRNNSSLRGQSLLASASSEVNQHILGGDHNVSILEKGGSVSLIFHFKEDMNDDDFEATKKRVRAQYGGARNAGEIGVTAGKDSLEIKEMGSKVKDMDFANLQTMAKIAIANQYAFPLILLDTDAATENNYGNAKEALYDDAALPFAKILLGELSDFLLPRYGEDPAQLQIVPDVDSISSLATRRNRELKIRKDIGIETYNELRESIPNRSPLPEGGEVVYLAANMIPIDQAGKGISDPLADAPPNNFSAAEDINDD